MPETGFLSREAGGRRYVVYVPHQVKPPYPTILFLHGRGESGSDGYKQMAIGLLNAVLWNMARWPFLIVAPQKPSQDKLWPEETDMLHDILHAVEKDFPTDPHRRYLTGLSQGGHGTFSLAKRLPWQFAAVAPVCGWGDEAQVVKDLADTPVWAFHGGKDDVITPDRSVKLIDALKPVNPQAKHTLFPEANHNSWDPTYQGSDLPTWLLSHSLGS